MTKVCTHCHVEKPLFEFAKKKTSADGRSSACKLCRREKYRIQKYCSKCGCECAFNTKHHFCVSCKAMYDAERKSQQKDEYKQLIQKLGCACCGFNHPDALEVHHLASEYKRFGTSQDKMYNIQDLEKEHAIVLCANCHLIFHSYFGGRSAKFPKQTKESTVDIINTSRRIAS